MKLPLFCLLTSKLDHDIVIDNGEGNTMRITLASHCRAAYQFSNAARVPLFLNYITIGRKCERLFAIGYAELDLLFSINLSQLGGSSASSSVASLSQ